MGKNLPFSIPLTAEDDGVRFLALDGAVYRWNGVALAWQCIKPKKEPLTEKPLHVQVAEALGYPPTEYITDEAHDPNRPIFGWRVCPLEHSTDEDPCEHSWHCGTHDYFSVPRYDTDWSATGPLIERYQIAVAWMRGPEGQDEWFAAVGRWPTLYEGRHLARPLLAVCHLILALHQAHKLPLR